MKYLFILLFCALYTNIKAQSAGKPVEEKQTQVAGNNSTSLKKEALNLQLRATNFLNDYLLTEKNKTLSPALRAAYLSKIALDAQVVNGSWQFALIQFLQSNKRDRTAIEFALQNGNRSIVLPYAVQYAIIDNDAVALEKYTAALDSLVPIERNAFVYHYNTLMSANKNATIYARGILDLVPLAVLQQQHNIRRDIHLKYYEGNIYETENAYLCLSIGKDVLQQYPGASYTGLLIKINTNNTISELEKHLFSDFDLSNFTNDNLSFSKAVPNKNYLPSFLILYKYYQQQNKDTKRLQKMIDKIRTFYGITDSLY